MKRFSSALCCFLPATLFTLSALAQQESPGASSPAPEDSTRLEEVVVTAERREERLQSLPITASAIDASTMANIGITDTMSLVQAIPGLNIQTDGGSAQPFLRGVGSTSSDPNDEPSVAFYIDGVYLGSPTLSLMSFNNIERIEVLDGPQGTLFGRNASGGVVQIITKTPSHDPSADLTVGYGNYETAHLSFYGTTGITDNLAADLAIYESDQNQGWGHDIYTGEDTFTAKTNAIRTKWFYTPTNDTKITLAMDYSKVHDEGVGVHYIPGSLAPDGHTTFAGFYNTTGVPNDHHVYDQGGISLRVDQDLVWAKFVSITSWRIVSGLLALNQAEDPNPLGEIPIQERYRDQTQEFQILSPDSSHIRWIVGAFYYGSMAAYDPLTLLEPAPLNYLNIYGVQDTRSYSGFGQTTIEVLPDTHFTAGLRYTTEKYSVRSSIASGIGVIQPLLSQSTDADKLTWKFGLDHQFTPDILGYVSASRGFKSGGYSLLAGTTPGYSPETLDDYEGGVKTEWFDHRLRLNADIFYYNYTNIQIAEIVQGSVSTLNAAGAVIKGIEANVTVVPIDNLTISGGVSAIRGKYTKFPDAPLYTPNPAGGDTLTSFNAKGNDTVDTPRLTYNLNASYGIPTQVGKFSLSGIVSYNGGFYGEPDNRVAQNSYFLVNATFGWTSVDGLWGASIWGKNLGDVQYAQTVFEETNGDQKAPAAPRTYGITFERHFRSSKDSR